jgi:hypothetical protein
MGSGVAKAGMTGAMSFAYVSRFMTPVWHHYGAMTSHRGT